MCVEPVLLTWSSPSPIFYEHSSDFQPHMGRATRTGTFIEFENVYNISAGGEFENH